MSNPLVVPCDATKDADFGPGVRCSQFDFTISFEQAIFGIGVSSLFLILFVARLKFLFRESVKVRFSWIQGLKTGIALGILAVQLALLILWVKQPASSVTKPAAALSFISALVVLFLVVFEHNRILQPSTLLTIYLLTSLITDGTETRTLFLRGSYHTKASLTAASLSAKGVLLLFECLSKKNYIIEQREYGPEEVAGIISRSVFWWLNTMLLRGNHAILTIKDLYPLDKNLHSEGLQTDVLRQWAKYQSKSPYSFLWANVALFRGQILWTIPARLCVSAFTYAQTFLITDSVNYLELPPQFRNVNHAYGLIGATALIYAGIAISTSIFYQRLYRITAAFRGSTSALIYAKSLVKQAGYNELAAVTLMSTDIDRMAMSLTRVMELWAQFIEVAVGVWLLWRQLGAIAIAPILITVLCFGMQSWASKPIGARQAKWVRAVQRRVGICSTVLRQMKSIKLSGLVEQMADLVQSERVRELFMAKQFRALQVWVQIIAQMPNTLSALVAFAAYSIKASISHTPQLTTAQAFTSFAILSLLSSPASQLLGSIPMIISGWGCVKRVHAFISSEPFDDSREILDPMDTVRKDGKPESRDEEKSSQDGDVPAVSLSNVVVMESSTPEKSRINFDAIRGTLTTILGPVACGKSTLLKAILGEVRPVSGVISVRTSFIGYCAQSPWLPNERIRDAITGANEFEEKWYRQVTDVCQLETDFVQMPEKDLTIMGSRGIVLSGGQKHRVALARALYSRCSILVLDDFLSSLDRKTRNAIAERLFTKDGHIRKHGLTVLLATHTTNYAHFSDNVIVMGSGGTLEYIGPPDEWSGLANVLAGVTDNDREDDEAAKAEILKGPGRDGKGMPVPRMFAPRLAAPDLDDEETTKRQSGDLGVWVYYAKSIGFWPIFFAISCVCTSVFMSNFPKLWLQWNTGDSAPKVPLFVGIYALASITAIAGQGGMMYQFMMVIGPKSGIRLHDILVRTAFGAPMNFFETTDSSILLNRFSQDMTLIDMQLPMSSFGFIISLFMCLMNLILICLGSTYIAASVPGSLIALYLIQRFYLRTSRQMRLLDLEHKSPLYRQFTETLEGLETIRALGWQEFSNRIAIDKLDTSQRPYYLLYMIQRWLNFVLDGLVMSLAVLLVSLALCVPSSSSGGAIGVALSSILSFNVALKMLIMTWTQAETSLGSVARTQSFEKFTPTEEGGEDLEPEASWPSGKVELKNMTLSYGDGTIALRNVSFAIEAGQKFGVCGRTGSGKSTLLSSLMRLVDPSDGNIIIDGVDISKVPRNLVRNRLICLPQDALIFPGTFRFNLDPVSKINDDEVLVRVLKRVGLWTMVEKRGGLNSDLKTDSLSHGEQQLLALARALVRKQIASDRCILVLDEATSNLDRGTETLIQDIIKQEFKANTVITVAHRLETVNEADCIIVLEKGEVVKMGPPADVL